MDKQRIGFIGCGKMAQAMVQGMIRSSFIDRDQLIVSTKSENSAESVREKFQIQVTLDNKEVASFADILIVAVKPHLYGDILTEIKNSVKKETIIVTLAAGLDISFVENKLSSKTKVIRSMPNTPSLVGEGMTVFSSNKNVSAEEIEYLKKLFLSFGKVEVVEERLMDYIPAISGSSPAYVYMFIDALAMGGVRSGIPANKAYQMAAQSVYGAAKMVLETGKHPSVLQMEVCTPGGTTIEAVNTLEQQHFKGTILAAMESCDRKNKQMKS
ncbi:pyrroline-5-carboxylate reductase [Bacillus sp. B1-b2]|uniref:pyrroline-5-carboxylate reductase n=1 Tax=Bacillus sp. B1-b2 TaxID=2653201 RepID=UPI00126164F7|nr:pyrroline-5-carboxylate reductase [Bacillus sp. B1-b2]KAB7666902.1 pyrroline-5-carboxylate reductase [Bacillus sp. B1-b2]